MTLGASHPDLARCPAPTCGEERLIESEPIVDPTTGKVLGHRWVCNVCSHTWTT